MYYRILDCWRLLAAILIMAYHFVFAAPYGAREASDFLHRLSPLLDLFFIISATSSHRAMRRHRTVADYAGFMRRRIARLYPLHLIVTLSSRSSRSTLGPSSRPLAMAARPSGAADHLLALHALGTTYGLALNYPSWSVSAEFFSYALFPLVVSPIAGRVCGLAGLLVLWLTGLEIASAMGLFPSGYWMTANACGAYAPSPTSPRRADRCRRRPQARRHELATAGHRADGDGGDRDDRPTAAYAIWVLLAASLTATAGAETARPDSTRILAPLQPLTRVSFGIYLWTQCWSSSS